MSSSTPLDDRGKEGGSNRKRSRVASSNGEPEALTIGSGNSALSSKSTRLHLDQILRTSLDFDFEKVCSVTLSPRSIYCCLVCGKFFQGRAQGSQLYIHALDAAHYVAMSLTTAQVYSLPNGELVEDPSLDDIRYNLKPVFTDEDIHQFAIVIKSQHDRRPALRDLHGNRYYPGLIGLNDLHGTDYVNSVVQALVRVGRLRTFFLKRSNWEQSESRVTRAFGELVCQMFSLKRFKNSASPHEFLQAISSASNKKFQVGIRTDASQFLAWLLFELHRGSGGTKKPMSSFIHECFQGEVRVETTVVELKREFGEEETRLRGLASGPALPGSNDTRMTTNGEEDDDDDDSQSLGTFTRAQVVSNSVERIPFLFLSLDLPTNPLFTDNMEGETVIPRTTLLELLEKYDGVKTVEETLPGGKIVQKRYRLTRLPEYLIFHLKRFTKNQFYFEKNRAIVSLPLANLDMTNSLQGSAITNGGLGNQFNLIANVCHDGGVGPGVKDAIADGLYKANVFYPPQDSWYETLDLQVKLVTMPQLVSVSETFIAIYENAFLQPMQ